MTFLHSVRNAFKPPWSLRAYLFAFGLTLILPGILFAAVGIAWIRIADRADQDRATLEMARSIANDLDGHLSGLITTLRALATSEALEQGDLTSFYRQAKRALPKSETNIVVRTLDNRQLLNTRVPWGFELGMSGDPIADADLVKRGEPWISDLFQGAMAKAPLYSVNLPVTLADGRVLILNMSQPAASLSRFLTSAGIEKPWGAAISDRSNRIIARSHEQDAHVGKPLTAETLRQTRGPEGVFDTVNLAGEHVLRAYTQSPTSGWTIAVWVPLEVADSRYWRSLRLVLFGGAGLLLLSTLLATWFGGMIAGPINAITAAATRLGRSEETPRLPSFPLQEANAVAGALRGAATQLSERRTAIQNSERRIREAHDRMALALDVTGLGMWERDLTTGKITWSEGMYRIFGRTREEFGGTGDEVLSYVHPEDRAAFRNAFDDNVRKGSSGFGQDFRVLRPDGEVRWVLRRAQLVRNEKGALATMLGVALDLTERRDKEEHITFLMRELAHRSKNLVAVIQAIAHQTARHTDSVPDFVERFSARLVAMARTHDLLTGRERGGASLEDLVQSQIEPFVESAGRQVVIDGPAAILDEATTQNIGFALHELATNAAKYGALSVPEGKVSIAWQPVTSGDGARALRLTWREMDGPEVTPPTRKGFGHIVIERTVADSLDAEVTLHFAPTGLIWQVDIPAKHFHLVFRSADTRAQLDA